MFAWLRRRQHERHAARIPDALWHATLAAYPFLAARPADARERLRALASEFLASKEFHGAQGLRVTDGMALAIAAQACLPVLHLGLAWYDDFVGIVVHPDEVLAPREAIDEHGIVHRWHEPLAGEAMERGPVMLNWRDVAQAGASAASGYNVVIHEFAHKLDQRDGRAPDGCPPLPRGFLGSTSVQAARQTWFDVLTPAHQTLRERVLRAERFGGTPPWLDPYGAQDLPEFFAVACEAYFVNRPALETELPALAPLFDAFFN